MMPANDFVFLDIDTQKELVEHFGERAIPHCPEIRENLMDLMSYAMRNELPILSPVLTDAGEKVLDAECERWAYKGEEAEDTQQVLFEHRELDPFENSQLLEHLLGLQPKNVVVFGVPLETSVRLAVEAMAAQDWRVWLIKDCVKGYEDEEAVLAELKQQKNVSLMTTRNTLKYLSELAF